MAIETDRHPLSNCVDPRPPLFLPDKDRLWLELDLLQKFTRNRNGKERTFASVSPELLERYQKREAEILEELDLPPEKANHKKPWMLKRIERETSLRSHQVGLYLLNRGK